MRVEKVSFAQTPEKITTSAYDCIWIAFESRANPAPLSSPALQWLDWKLRGQISRFLVDKAGDEQVTFLPTMRKLSVPFLALQPGGKVAWEQFQKNCEGLKLKNVLFFCEDPESMGELEKGIKGRSFESFPETVVLGSDS
jgi:hypothetical protein